MQKQTLGWINGFIGMLIFSGSLPATKIAITSFSPEFLTCIRAVIATFAGIICLCIFRQFNLRNIHSHQIKSLLIVGLGVVIGFPLFTAMALEHIDSSRAIVFVGLLPLATAIFGVLRASERPRLTFWIFAILGAGCVITFMLSNASSQKIGIGDFYMLLSILLCGLGYAEGGLLSKTLGGWQVICWALIFSCPLMLFLMFYYLPSHFQPISIQAILGLLYVSLFSMLIGFFFWYKGLALGGVAQVGQIQLIQPFFGLLLSAFILGEHISLAMIFTAIAVVLCVLLAKKYA
ncbi:DMT family transporter [Acinetobacter shaoyimingii]|uniref:DMT family transporter n=1 Tax=Acinetobacter shaoyimingii TaxID=2715164 RepID=A0A6G8RVG4_9GAMM|nr:DMT family transporter [Acinetobacter shaoyimingii]QIO05929.1 DMT family transporter [Acinetobacter shaoyimingii]